MPKHILIVDDDPIAIKVLTRLLVAHGYLVLAAANGEDLLARVTAFRPDAVLMDVMLPGMDGVQLAERLGQMPATASTPIIFLSALISPDQPQDSPSNPRHHFLGKSFEPEALLELLKRIGA